MLLDDDEFGEPMDVDLPPLPQSLIQLRVPRLKPEPVSDDEELLVVDVKKFQGQPLQTPMNAFGFDEMAEGAARSLVNPSVMTVETVKRERVVESIESSQSFGLDSTEDSDDEDVDPNRGRRQSRGGMRMLGHQGQYIY